MARRVFTYDEQFHNPHWLSTIGAFLLAAAFLLILVYLLYSLVAGRRAPANPWGAATLEWQCSSPPPHDNFASPPPVGDPYEFRDLQYDDDSGGYVRQPAPATP
jgi:cytochrome c oxidase subunit 1